MKSNMLPRLSTTWARPLPRRAIAILFPLAVALAALAAATAPARSQDFPVIHNNFGSGGALDMPSARMGPDGQFAVGASFMANTQRYFLNWQILPWLEGSFRYSGLAHFDPLYSVYYDRSFAFKARLWDETPIWPSFAVGVNDTVGTGVYAGEYFVLSKRFGALDATVGLGFGRLGSTSTFRNPFVLLSHSFSRRESYPITPGSTAFNTWFHGEDSGLFASIIWNTPLDGLSLVAEYSSDRYLLEATRGTLTPRTQLNYGFNYQISDVFSTSLAWMYGTTLNGTVSIELDPTRAQYQQKITPIPVQPSVRPIDERQSGIEALLEDSPSWKAAAAEQMQVKNQLVDRLWSTGTGVEEISFTGRNMLMSVDGTPAKSLCMQVAELVQDASAEITNVEVRSHKVSSKCTVRKIPRARYLGRPAISISDIKGIISSVSEIDVSAPRVRKGMRDKIIRDAAQQGLHIEEVRASPGRVTVYYSNNKYFAEAEALDRLTRVLMADLPPEIEEFRLISVRLDVPQQEFDIIRSAAERNFEQEGSLNLFDGPATQHPAPLDAFPLGTMTVNPYPHFAWDISPQFRQQLFDPNNPFAVQLLAAGYASLQLFRGLSLNAEGEFDIYDNYNNRGSDSLLPHVRSDFEKYFSQGKNGIGELDATYRFRLSPTIFGILKSGYLESMFAGGGGEVLWRPEGARWGIGIDGYEVWQRNFDRLFGLQPYKQFTGHLSLYYQSPWYQLNFALRVGQYLAGDRGTTVEITRRFSTGVEIGAFATKTNVSAAQFGEGSFDKGIIIRIPLGWVTPIETQSVFGMDLRPVQRDGGQRLVGDAQLWEETRRTSEGEILNSLGRSSF